MILNNLHVQKLMIQMVRDIYVLEHKNETMNRNEIPKLQHTLNQMLIKAERYTCIKDI